MPGPVLVMIGKVFSAVEEQAVTAHAGPSADARAN